MASPYLIPKPEVAGWQQEPMLSRQSGDRDRRPGLAFIWSQFGAHHIDRCDAVARALAGRFRVYGVEIGSGAERTVQPTSFPLVSLHRGDGGRGGNLLLRTLSLIRLCLRLRARYVFAGNSENPAIFALAILFRCLARPVFTLQEAKFDDKDRRLGIEAIRSLFHLPYSGAIAGSLRARDYLRFLGIRADRIFLGYDTVSVSRVRRCVPVASPVERSTHENRHFTVLGRFASPAALMTVLEAYHRYAAAAAEPRELWYCDAGDATAALTARAGALQLRGVHFCEPDADCGIAQVLATTLAVIQPGLERPHGLLVSEAIALGVPLLVSEDCAARDLLVRSAVNGYVYEADNIEGLAHYMRRLGEDSAEWARLASGTAALVEMADAARFADSVALAIGSIGSELAPAEQTAR